MEVGGETVPQGTGKKGGNRKSSVRDLEGRCNTQKGRKGVKWEALLSDSHFLQSVNRN